MPRDYIPPKDADFLAWSLNYSTIISAGPVALGLTAGNATQLATLQSAFSTSLAAATNPATRGGATVLQKDLDRVALESYCRELAMAIQGTLTVTDPQKYELGLTVRSDEPTPINPPAFAPGMMVVSAVVRTVKVRLFDPENPTKRGKPSGCSGATIFSFVGNSPPAEIASWKFEGNTTRTVVDVEFPSTVASGAMVWICAFWRNPRDLSGPACNPISINLPGGAVMAA